MPRISDDYLQTVIYLYQSIENAKEGIATGGTGFLVSVPSSVENMFYIYAVTNRHVIRRGKSPVIRLNMIDGSTQTIDLNGNQWIDHPDLDDLSITPIQIDILKHKVKAIPVSMFITKKIIEEYSIGPGDDAYIIGRFVTHDGKQKNLPAARFGNIAMMPWVPVEHPDGILQESFLLEMRSLNGYSGSPAFVHIPPFRLLPGAAELNTDSFTWFLGVDWGHLHTKEEVLDSKEKRLENRLFVKSNSGMTSIVPAWKLLDLLESEEFVLQRTKQDEIMTFNK